MLCSLSLCGIVWQVARKEEATNEPVTLPAHHSALRLHAEQTKKGVAETHEPCFTSMESMLKSAAEEVAQVRGHLADEWSEERRLRNGMKWLRVVRHVERSNDKLTDLDLSGNGLGDLGLSRLASALSKNSVLRSLDVRANGIGAQGARRLAVALERCSLECLDLGGNQVGDEGAAWLCQALQLGSSLAELRLSSTGIGSRGAAKLAEVLPVSKLRSLKLRDNKVGADGATQLAAALAAGCSLTELHLASADIGDNGAVALAVALERNTSLTALNLWRNSIGAHGGQRLGQALERNASLLSLTLRDNDVGDAGAVALAAALHGAPLARLDLWATGIGTRGARSLANALQQNDALAELALAGNLAVGPEIGRCVAHNAALHTLDLAATTMGDEGVAALVDAYQTNAGLTSLDLASTGITVLGAQNLADGILAKPHCRLASLSLLNNDVADDGAVSIAAALQDNASLSFLNLQANRIGDRGAMQLAATLELNTSLAQLHVNSNAIGHRGAAALVVAVANNPCITLLSLWDNNIPDAAKLDLERTLAAYPNRAADFVILKRFTARSGSSTGTSTTTDAHSPCDPADKSPKVSSSESQSTEREFI